MSTGLIVVLVLLLGPYVLMNAVRLARGRSWAITPCTVLKEADLRRQAERRAAREQAPGGPARAATPRPRPAPGARARDAAR